MPPHSPPLSLLLSRGIDSSTSPSRCHGSHDQGHGLIFWQWTWKDRDALEAEYQLELADLEEKSAERGRLCSGYNAVSKAVEAIEEERRDVQRRHTAALKVQAQWRTAMFAADDEVKEAEKKMGPSIRRELE